MKMKRTLPLLLCLAFTAVFLGGCGDDTAVLAELNTERYVKLGEYKGLAVSVPARTEVTDDYKQNYIGYVLSSNSVWEEVTDGSAAKMGDLVTIDYVGKQDGVAFDRGSDENFALELGSGTFIPGFEEGVVGVCKGVTKDVSLNFPDPYRPNPDLSGAPVVFTVTVNKIERKQIPELTDDFVQTLGVGCSTVAEYEKYVEEILTKEAQNTYDSNVEEALIAQVMESSTFPKEPPKAMVDQYYDRVVKNMSKIAASSQMTLEVLITSQGSTMEKFEEEARKGAAASCRESIMLQAIANAEQITVSQEEVDAYLQEAAENRGYESVSALQADLGFDHYEDFVMCEKVLALMRDSAVITEY